MDWHMDPVFRSIFRQAEQTDARLGIRRDEKRDEGRKKDHERPDEEPGLNFEEERPTVSVAALSAFLESLVQTLQMKIPAQPTPDHIVPTVLPAREAPSPAVGAQKSGAPSPIAARAASAYRHVAEGRGGTDQKTDSGDSGLALAHQADFLSAADLRTIHFLLDSLKTLKTPSLVIEKAPTFLQSLVDAVHRARAEEAAS